MTKTEETLVAICQWLGDKNDIAITVQAFIAEEGPLSEDAAAKIRELMEPLK